MSGPSAVVPTEHVLAEILRCTRTTTRGATIKQLLPLFGEHRSTAFKRFRSLLKEGLIVKNAGTNGEYLLTEAGLSRYANAKKAGH